jgi:hypothetical protein
VPPTLRKEMSGVCKACFAGDSSRLPARHMQVSWVWKEPRTADCILASDIHTHTHAVSDSLFAPNTPTRVNHSPPSCVLASCTTWTRTASASQTPWGSWLTSSRPGATGCR